MTAVLTATHLTCRVPGRVLLSDISLTVHRGESVALFGPSGSGKTTLLAAVGGLIRVDAGEIRLSADGDDNNRRRKRDGAMKPGRGVAHVLQGYGLVSLLTAAENLELALRVTGRSPAEATETAHEMLDRLDVGRVADHLVEELSGGQEQRVAVARALVTTPRLLLADEPTAEQDAEHRELVLRHLLAATEDGAGLLVATHDEEVAERCDRVLDLREGELVERVET